jgi:hypothetical protein
MAATLKAKFDGKQFLPETVPALEPGRTYLLHVQEVDPQTRAGKIAALRHSMKDQAFLSDLQKVAADFTDVDSEC